MADDKKPFPPKKDDQVEDVPESKSMKETSSKITEAGIDDLADQIQEPGEESVPEPRALTPEEMMQRPQDVIDAEKEPSNLEESVEDMLDGTPEEIPHGNETDDGSDDPNKKEKKDED